MAEIFPQAHAAGARDEADDRRILRLHRYYVARALAAGRDVLDMRGGDGSGPAVLAQTARRVVARTAEPAQAARDFDAPNLTFIAPDEAVSDADLVLAFGLLDRVADPAALAAALRGLVRPGGMLMLEAACGDAPGLRHRLSADELGALLRPHFAHLEILPQAGLIGSVLQGAGVAKVFAHHQPLAVEASLGIASPDALLCIAGDAPCALGGSLMIDAPVARLAEARARAAQARRELAEIQAAHAALVERSAARAESDAAWRHLLATARVSEAAAASRATALEAERDALVAAQTAIALGFAARDRETAANAAALAAENARLRGAGPDFGRLLRRLRRLTPDGLRGLANGRAGARLAAIRGAASFDADWYLATYADVRAAGLDPARHYLRNGAAEGRNPGPAFDAAWYEAQHDDLRGSGLTAVEHYERHGRTQGWPTAPAAAEPRRNPRILFVSGEPDTPGSVYRCERYAAAARAAGHDAGWSRIERTGAQELIGVEIAVLWRVRWSRHVEGVMHEVHQGGGQVVFDVDDLMIRPELAQTRVIDGIRTTNAGIGSTRETFAQVQQAMIHADLCSTTTDELAGHMRAWQKAVFVLPNGFDAATHAAARRAVRARVQAPDDGRVRIGYPAGTVTHQKDFAAALPGLVRVLAARDNVRLVLFRAKDGPELVVVDEFEALAPYADRIEWRDKVALADLPAELARFDINIAPLEGGNPFCEAKSELKYFEAALVDVPTIASPTGPYQRCIRNGVTGMLAEGDEAWQQALLRLVDDAGLRRVMGRAAYLDCLWSFGPGRRAELADAFIRQVRGGADGARAWAYENFLSQQKKSDPVTLAPSAKVFHSDRMGQAAITVIVPCFNYAAYVIEALDSVRLQTIDVLDLVIVDDCSTDELASELIASWAEAHAARFNRLVVVRHAENAGLSAARNTGFAEAETAYVLPLDADNRLRTGCCAALLAAIEGTQAAFAYPSLQMFGAADAVFGNEAYRPARLTGGNYIDAMALIGKAQWAAVGGYEMPRNMGWEDFDLWCKFAARGFFGVHVDEVLADYRVHGGSMVSTLVETDAAKAAMVAHMELRHPWLRLSSRTPHQRV